MFPQGRSDKVYTLAQGNKHTKDGYPAVELTCYKSRGKGIKLIYSVKLKIVYKPPRDKTIVRNMLDYISLLGSVDATPNWRPFSYVVPGNISKTTKSDLSLKQGLVVYSCNTVMSVLYVQCFSSKTATSLNQLELAQSFDVPTDEVDSKLSRQDEWYKTYGFPVAACELTTRGDK
ncbi:hypothetical protein LLG46_10305 [bacterium]|nr:hypothetical protein [bacterium]